MKIQDVLVPIDFSPASLNGIAFAKSLMNDDGEMLLLHVIDDAFIKRAVSEGLAQSDDLCGTLRKRAEEALDGLIQEHGEERVTIKSLVVIGTPFAEILRLCNDLAFSMIVMGTRGRFGSNIEQALFGSTAERVQRGARVPVVTVPRTQ